MNLIPIGTYTAKAMQWDLGENKDGSPKLAVQFEITEGEYEGVCITWYGYFTEKAQARTLESLRYCGWSSDDIVTMDGMGDYLVQIVVEHEVANEGKSAGTTFAKVRWVNRLGGGGPIKLEKPMDMAQKRMFAAKMRMHAKQVPVMKGGYKVERAATEKGESDGKGDIPF